ncbi:MAG: outer membrane beta-barrel protein [Flavobacterium sp.]|nr:outer membrane beta-barrel protein [Flavobacterium sp.]
MNKFFWVLFAVGLFMQSIAQTNNNFPNGSNKNLGVIIGNVLDAQTNKPIAFATLMLSLKADSTKKITQVADKNGGFEFEKLAFGYYRLTITATGFANNILDSINIRSERYDFNLGDVKMKPSSSSNLDEIIVYSEKPLIENTDGKITYNVGESALSNGASTSEILKNMPLISNDPNGKILLKGKEPKILIDDKPTDLTADQLKDLLESLPGSSIEKIELMTNPPAQYATEQGGVINIVTKKGKIGLTGKITVSAGSRGEGSLAANASYRNQKFSTNHILGIAGSKLTGNSYAKRENIYADSTNYFNTESNWKSKNLRPNLRSQFDYEIDKYHQLNLVYQGNLNFFDNISTTQYTNINRFVVPYKISTRENGSNGTGYNHNITFNYTHKTKNSAEILRFALIGGFGKNDNGKDYFQQFLNPFYQPTGVDSTQSQYYNSYNKTLQARLSYDKPLDSGKVFLSTGATYQIGSNHNTLNTQFFRKQDSSFVPNDLLSNNFKFNQNIFTVRLGFTYIVTKSLRIIAGAQAENTATNFNFIKGNSKDVGNNYWNVLPNITIRKEFNRTFNTALVYRASIRRPDLGQLNPNIDYSDPYNVRFGNPYLSPSLADNFDWNLSLIKGKYYINTSLGYNNVKNVFYQIRTLIEAGKTQLTYQNIANREEYEASIWGGYTFTKKLRVNASAGYTFNKYSEAEKQLFKYQDGGSFYTSCNYSFTPTNLLTFEGSTRYNSYADPQGRSRSNVTMNLGVQHKFFNKRVIVNFNIFDPFTTQQYTTYTYGSNFNIENYSSTTTRNYRLGVSYQLSKIIKKSTITSKQRQSALDKLKKKA